MSFSRRPDNPMKVSVISPKELDPTLLACWKRIRTTRPDLASPFYAPEFTLAVGTARDDLHVAVIETDRDVVGFFPFHRLKYGRGRPVGIALCDYQGVILTPEVDLCLAEFIRDCGLYFLPFDHVPSSQTAFAPYTKGTSRSPIMDIRGGIEAYRNRLAQHQGVGNPGIIRAAGTGIRRMERELGPVRLEPCFHDRTVFERLFRWKSAQFLSKWKAERDPFADGWVRDCIEHVFSSQTDEFSGALYALYAGDALVAAEFGLKSGSVLHSWFCSYDPAFSIHSPGILLRYLIAENGSRLGIDIFDLGRGEHSYKLRLMTGAVPLIEGFACWPGTLEHLVIPARRWRRRLRSLFTS